MGQIKTFNDIVAWQKAHELTLTVYQILKSFPKYEEFSLSSQIRRCAISIPSNIAEGFKRKSSKESYRFYNIAEGSLEELKYQLLLSKDLNYITAGCYNNLLNLANEVGKLINGWKKSQI